MKSKRHAFYHSLILPGLILIFFEWMFEFTKPSFLSSLETTMAVFILLNWFAAAPAIIVILDFLFHKLDSLLQHFFGFKSQVLRPVIPAFLAALIVLLLVDNFTYTLFRLGIKNAAGIYRLFYGIGFIGIFGSFWNFYHKRSTRAASSIKTVAIAVCAALIVLVPIYKIRNSEFSVNAPAARVRGQSTQYPNIIIFASDGIEANHLSAYGYNRKTSPYLDTLSEKMLVAENTISNAGKSTGSVTTLLTGKLPTTTKVFFPPHILTGKNSLEHLPGILTNLGYSTFQESVRYYLDGADLGMSNSFRFANHRDANGTIEQYLPTSVSLAFFNEIFFMNSIRNRIHERLLHIFGIRSMLNPC